jgi:uncharacterized membrane protein HdeD (DUF308 family)
MSTDTSTSSTVPSDVRNGWRTLMGVGVLIAVLGLLAIFAPFLTGIVLSISLGLILVAGSLGHVAHAFSARGWSGSLWQVLLAVVYAAAGVSLVLNPLFGLATLTFLLIGYLLASGVVEIAMGFRTRSSPQWGALVASGALSLLVAVLLWFGLPTSALWAVGLLVGISLLSTGVSLVLLANTGRKATVSTEEAADETAPGA